MRFKTVILPLLAMGVLTAPAFAQNRFMDQAKENAQRRSDNKSVREAEHPEDTPKPAATAPATPSAPVAAAAAPVAPSAPVTAAAAPAPTAPAEAPPAPATAEAAAPAPATPPTH